jgi:hypothetical protein
MKGLPAPNPNLPLPPDRYDAGVFQQGFETINKAMAASVRKDAAVGGVLLQSADGSVYKVEVDNAGNVTTTAVALGQQGSPNY